MLQAFEGGDPAFLEGTRWLDLFAGTGSVGLEALSRGASHCQFIELDSWVVQKVLGPNIEACGGEGAAVVHTGVLSEREQHATQIAHMFPVYSNCVLRKDVGLIAL